MNFIQTLLGPPGLILVAALLGTIGAFWASQQQGQFERQLREKSEEIAELNERTLNAVTGGDSFAYVAFARPSEQSNEGMLIVIHQGVNPLFDVYMRIVDLQTFAELGGDVTLNNFMHGSTQFQLGTLVAGHARTLGKFSLGTETKRSFNIFFAARNGGFSQLVRFVRVADRWRSAYRVKRNGEVIHEKIDEEFPRNQAGAVEW
ncbi:MAG: hypothetical protein HYY81_05490 [Deltaproteobacteria bacterium]|nr:hypothetical protein [Deltaproteobacteria bacterium]